MQRKMTKWSLIFVAVFIPAIIIMALSLEHRLKKTLEDTQRPHVAVSTWIDVDRNIRIGDFDKAILLGEELILKAPQNPIGHQKLAEAYLAEGIVEKALVHYEESYRLFPSTSNEELVAAIHKRIKEKNPQQ